MSGRLPSFRSPRDLSLGSKDGATKKIVKPAGIGKSAWPEGDKKKKFTPNLNVQRKEQKPSTSGEAPSTSKKGASGWKKTNHNDKNDFKKSAKFNKPALIQVSSSIFGDGIGDDSRRKSGWGGSGGGSSDREPSQLERPKLDLNAKIDKKEEEEKLKQLLRDDFIDDLKTGHLVPVQLPMVDTGKMFKEELSIKSEKPDDDDILRKTGAIKKNRIVDSDDEEDEKPKVAFVPSVPTKEKELTLRDLLEDRHSELMFFQMPDHLPGPTKKDQEEKEGESVPQNLSLIDLNEGFLGKMQFRKSGRVQLSINNVLFDVDIGTQVGFLQELYSVNNIPAPSEDSYNSVEKGNLTNLGRVRNRIVTMPAWSDLLEKANFDDSSSSDDDEEVS